MVIIIKNRKKDHPTRTLLTVLSAYLPKRMLDIFILDQYLTRPMADFSDKTLAEIKDTLQDWTIKPNATQGYRTAEVTLGGVDTDAISSKTMEVKTIPGLYFIGEVLDVTGWLGGYNFQWAWSSGWAAGKIV